MRICIIDDNDLLSTALSFGLEDRGHEVFCARTGAEGVAAVEAGAFDVVVLDWHMPGMRGDAAAEKIRAVRPGAKILMMSGGSVNDELDLLRTRGGVCDHFIEKPFTPSQLLQAIDLTMRAASSKGEAKS